MHGKKDKVVSPLNPPRSVEGSRESGVGTAPDLYERLAKQATLLRETAVHIEQWSHSPMISCDRSDAMENVAGKLRAEERLIRAALAKARGA